MTNNLVLGIYAIVCEEQCVCDCLLIIVVLSEVC